MRSFLLSALLASSFTMHAGTALSTYDDVIAHFQAGDSLKLHVYLDQCEMSNFVKSGIEFSVDANPIMKVGTSLKFSTTHFTRNNPKHRGESIFEYLRYVLSDDNHVHITAQVLDPNTHNILDPEMNFDCEMGKAAVFYASK